MTTPDKWERRSQRQSFMKRCAALRRLNPQLTALTARKIWDRASKMAQSAIAQRARESDSAVVSDSAQSQITHKPRDSDSALAAN